MNLAAYDSMIDNFTDHTYIEEYYRTMYSMDIEFRKNYCFLSKYNNETKATDIFICMIFLLKQLILIKELLLKK